MAPVLLFPPIVLLFLLLLNLSVTQLSLKLSRLVRERKDMVLYY